MSGAIVAIGGLALSVGTTAMSFAGAAKQKRAARDAERAAAMAMAEVEKELTKNEMDALSINKEAYEIMEDQVDAQVATQMAANREGDQRGAIAGANRVQAGNLEAAGQIRTAMGNDLGDLEKLSADEATRKSDIRTQIKLGEAGGAQRAAAEASDASAQLKQEAFAGVANVAQQGLAMVPTYSRSKDARQVAGMQKDFKKNARNEFLQTEGNTRKMFNDQYSAGQFQSNVGGLSYDADKFGSLGTTQVMNADGTAMQDTAITSFDQLSKLSPQEFELQLQMYTPAQRNMIMSQLSGNFQ
jgi:hypothetical protein